MQIPTPEYQDIFGRVVEIGDEVATFSYEYSEPLRGIITRFGKGQAKVALNFGGYKDDRWIKFNRMIRTRTRAEIATI